MIKGISAWVFDPQRPLPEVFRMARENGFDAIEVAIDESGPITPQSSQDDCRRIIEQAQNAGVRLSSMASGGGWRYPVSCEDEATRQKGIEFAKASLRVAQWLEVDAILLVPGGVGADFIPGFKGAPYDVAYDNVLAALRELAPVAEECGVSIGVENVWNKFLLSPLEFRALLDEVNNPRVGCYFDVGNVLLTGYPEQWIRILGSRIVRVHLKDFKKSVGTLEGFCNLLEGDVDYAAVMSALRDIGYDGFVTPEYFNAEADLPQISSAVDKILAL
jgi:L-ribulose-5-phosphate 3-epimerase